MDLEPLRNVGKLKRLGDVCTLIRLECHVSKSVFILNNAEKHKLKMKEIAYLLI